MKAAKTRALNAKHAGTRKHAGTGKHTPSARKKAAAAHAQKAHRTAAQVKAAKARALGSLPCCVAESVAASARLAGWPVTGAATLELFRRMDGPATIPATLEAAYRYGLAGLRPVGFGPLPAAKQAQEWLPGPGTNPGQGLALILGLELPEGPHAVCLDPSGDVWSWGSLYEMTAEAVIEEAWAVVWP